MKTHISLLFCFQDKDEKKKEAKKKKNENERIHSVNNHTYCTKPMLFCQWSVRLQKNRLLVPTWCETKRYQIEKGMKRTNYACFNKGIDYYTHNEISCKKKC